MMGFVLVDAFERNRGVKSRCDAVEGCIIVHT